MSADRLVIRIDTGNAAFHQMDTHPGQETGRILRQLAHHVETHGLPQIDDPTTLMDANGNNVGQAYTH